MTAAKFTEQLKAGAGFYRYLSVSLSACLYVCLFSRMIYEKSMHLGLQNFTYKCIVPENHLSWGQKVKGHE